jgi:hypothetical protein
MVGQDVGDDLIGGRRGVDLRGGDVGVSEDPLDVGQGQAGVTDHSFGRAVSQVVKRPVRAESGVGLVEDHAGRVVG